MLIRREDLRNRLVRLVAHGRLVTTTRAFEEGARRLNRFLLMQLAINAGLVQPPDANRLYVVFVEDNVPVGMSDGSLSRADFLGYHSAFAGRDAA